MYLFSTDLPDRESPAHRVQLREQWQRYRDELERIAEGLPPATRAFALAEWHYEPADHRCPHDAWLKAATVREVLYERDVQHRELEIIIQLLGAYHDGLIELSYSSVKSYRLDSPVDPRERQVNRGHGDWLIDEIRRSDRGAVLHEIEWAHGARWSIECVDVHYKWLPVDDTEASTEPA